MALSDFHEQLLAYQAHLSIRLDISHNSLLAYQIDIKQFDEWFCKAQDGNLTTLSQIVEQFINYLFHEKKLKPRSIKRKVITLKSFLKFYHQLHPEYPNPFSDYSLRFPKTKELPRVLSQQEAISLLTAVQSKLANATPYHSIFVIRDLAILDLLLCTGIRIGELASIRLQDIDINTCSLRIIGKGNKERLIYISTPDVMDEIKNWIKQRKNLNPQSSHLFLNKYGQGISIYAIENIFYKYKDIAQINPDATPHYLRHTFASADTFAA